MTQTNQNGSSSTTPTLDQYKAFHGMLCSPSTASSCVQSFRRNNGCIFFGPCTVVMKFDGTPNTNLSNFDTYDYSTTLTTWWYYVLCLAAGFLLCTHLGLTDFMDAREFDDGMDEEKQKELLRSAAYPDEIQATDAVLKYVQNHINENDSAQAQQSLRLKRRFEYHFKMVYCNVIMLHFVSSSPEGVEVLHLVEVYRFGHPIANGLASILRVLVSFVMGMIRLISTSSWKKTCGKSVKGKDVSKEKCA